MSTWRRHRAHRNNRASSMAPPGEEGWTIRHDPAILHSEPYASADLGAASDVDRQVLTVRGCVGLFAEPDLTPTSGWRHLIDAGAKRPWPTPSAQTRDKAGPNGQSARTIQPIQRTLGSSSTITSRPMCTVYAHFFVATNTPRPARLRDVVLLLRRPLSSTTITHDRGGFSAGAALATNLSVKVKYVHLQRVAECLCGLSPRWRGSGNGETRLGPHVAAPRPARHGAVTSRTTPAAAPAAPGRR